MPDNKSVTPPACIHNLLGACVAEMESKGMKPGEISDKICGLLGCSKSTYYNLLAARRLPKARLQQIHLLIAMGML